MAAYGLLIDYKWCTGCHTCEIACQMEKGLPPNKFGIQLHQIGPTPKDDGGWMLDYIPNPTDLCDLCADRTAAGKLPTCVHHCQSKCMEYGTIEELAKKLAENPKQVLFAL